ncbi:cytochrome C oxidase subunit IV family protein [Carboxylicivirga marina]|uniref:Cytochrome C oxidase subunit IV family protein n=1 Tax=Carboxylicivirga marina TaxID=2800988 RepID=A0ABS1HFR9_9BACT|nr:cytochrome C oxidase subunit IV family protein [Carboxylicivirga marina]
MNKHTENHVVPYSLYIYVLAGLLLLTMLSVGVTHIELANLTVFTAILLASIKSCLVLVFFMHLKFDNRILQILVTAVFILVALVLFITFLDYNYR